MPCNASATRRSQSSPSTSTPSIRRVGPSGPLWSIATAPTAALNGTWQHVALRYDGVHQTLVVDGVEVATTPLDAQHYAPSLYSNLHVGSFGSFGHGARNTWPGLANVTGFTASDPAAFFVGEIDELAIFPTHLPTSNLRRRARFNNDDDAAISVGFGLAIRTPVADYPENNLNRYNYSADMTPYVIHQSPIMSSYHFFS